MSCSVENLFGDNVWDEWIFQLHEKPVMLLISIPQFTMLVTSFVHKHEITMGFKEWSKVRDAAIDEHLHACLISVQIKESNDNPWYFPAVFNVFWSINPSVFLAAPIMSTVTVLISHGTWPLNLISRTDLHGYRILQISFQMSSLSWGVAVDKIWNMEHSVTSRNIPEHSGTFRNIPDTWNNYHNYEKSM